jgi:hypothetical protein
MATSEIRDKFHEFQITSEKKNGSHLGNRRERFHGDIEISNYG